MYSTIKLILEIYKEFLVIITGWITLLKNEPKIRKKFFTGLINVESNKATSLVFWEIQTKEEKHKFFACQIGEPVVSNSPTMKETLVQFLDWEDPLEKG